MAIEDSTKAIDLHPHYIKAILRRAELYEKTEKLDEALKDYEKVVELDPSQHSARAACMVNFFSSFKFILLIACRKVLNSLLPIGTIKPWATSIFLQFLTPKNHINYSFCTRNE